MRAFSIAHFQEDQTKYQLSQTHVCVCIYVCVCKYVCVCVCIYVCIYIYTHTPIYIYKEKVTPTSQQLDGISAVQIVVCQFGEITRWKNWKNLCAGKNIFICIKSVLKKKIPVISWVRSS